MAALDPGAFDVLTFDCYGTLIDWERGLLTAFTPLLLAHGVRPPEEDALLEAYARHESGLQGGGYLSYREVVASALDGVASELGFSPEEEEREAFADAVGDWPPFEDSHAALSRLHERYRLAAITNCDDDLFARSQLRLGVTFDEVVTAEQAGAYKPDHAPFLLAFERLGVPRGRILHVAQSLFHDHVPAAELGLRSVWVDRRHGRPGGGATPPAHAEPEVTVPSLAALADLLR